MKKHVKRKIYFSKSLREEEKKKKKKRQAPHNLAYVVSANTVLAIKKNTKCIALWTLCLPQSNVYENQLELQQVSLIPFPQLDILLVCKS